MQYEDKLAKRRFQTLQNYQTKNNQLTWQKKINQIK